MTHQMHTFIQDLIIINNVTFSTCNHHHLHAQVHHHIYHHHQNQRHNHNQTYTTSKR